MAGMFYSLKEAAEKLNRTEEEVKQIVKEGRLREFRDGPNLLFKIDEVEALMSDTSIMASKKSAAPSEQQRDKDEISLVPEPTEDTDAKSDLTGADTAVADEGTSLLGQTGTEQQVPDDTMSETKAISEEASLEEIEEDVSLDTFGSGSGLLDLSLQADDTSLGGILDEIYAPEGAEAQEAAEGSAMEVAAEAEQMLSETELDTTQPELEAPVMVQDYVEAGPDTISNALGIMLFLPLLAIIYTAIVVAAGFQNVTPTIMKSIQGIIWYVVAGIAVAAIIMVGAGFALGGKTGRVGKKPKKAKKTAKEEPTPETGTA
jgi:hypothetical protein